jgi:hypothetical protein
MGFRNKVKDSAKRLDVISTSKNRFKTKPVPIGTGFVVFTSLRLS